MVFIRRSLGEGGWWLLPAFAKASAGILLRIPFLLLISKDLSSEACRRQAKEDGGVEREAR